MSSVRNTSQYKEYITKECLGYSDTRLAHTPSSSFCSMAMGTVQKWNISQLRNQTVCAFTDQQETCMLVLHFMEFHRCILNHCTARPPKHSPMGQSSDKYQPIHHVKAIPTQKLIRALAKTKTKPKQEREKHNTIWFWVGQKLYSASHFSYIKHIALAG